jgi:hypothetical protein
MNNIAQILLCENTNQTGRTWEADIFYRVTAKLHAGILTFTTSSESQNISIHTDVLGLQNIFTDI